MKTIPDNTYYNNLLSDILAQFDEVGAKKGKLAEKLKEKFEIGRSNPKTIFLQVSKRIGRKLREEEKFKIEILVRLGGTRKGCKLGYHFLSPEKIDLSQYELMVPSSNMLPIAILFFNPDTPLKIDNLLYLQRVIRSSEKANIATFVLKSTTKCYLIGTKNELPIWSYYHFYQKVNEEIQQDLGVQTSSILSLALFKNLDSYQNQQIALSSLEDTQLFNELNSIADDYFAKENNRLSPVSLRELLSNLFGTLIEIPPEV